MSWRHKYSWDVDKIEVRIKPGREGHIDNGISVVLSGCVQPGVLSWSVRAAVGQRLAEPTAVRPGSKDHRRALVVRRVARQLLSSVESEWHMQGICADISHPLHKAASPP